MSATVSSALPIGTPSLILRMASSSLALASALSLPVTLIRLRPSLAAGIGHGRYADPAVSASLKYRAPSPLPRNFPRLVRGAMCGDTSAYERYLTEPDD